MPKSPRRHSPAAHQEHIVIVGGGLEGCLAALFAAQVRDEHGRPKYHITLLEKEDKLLNGASIIASRLHLGGEYPLDQPTAKDCLLGAIIWKLVMPKSEFVYTDRQPMRFTVSEATERNASGAAPHQRLTVASYLHHYEQVREEYRKLFAHVHETMAAQKPHWNEQKTASLLFGKPEDFFRQLTPDELARYQGPTSKVAGGFQSQEVGLNIPYYLAYIEEAIRRTPNIDVRTGSKVWEITSPDPDEGGLEHGRDRHNFIIHYETGHEQTESLDNVDHVIQAAWEGGPALTSLPEGKKVKVYRRAMVLMDVSEVDEKLLDPTFIMLAKDGGMLSPYNSFTAVGYVPHPKAAYFGGNNVPAQITLHDELDEIPESWTKEPRNEQEKAEREAWMQRYFELLKERFPFLEKAKPVKLIIRNTLNFQEIEAQRRHEPTALQDDGRVVMYATKATLAPRSAIEAVEFIRQRSAAMEHGGPMAKPPAPSTALVNNKTFLTALAGAYSIDGLVPLVTGEDRENALLRAHDFAQKHDLITEMALQHHRQKEVSPTLTSSIAGKFLKDFNRHFDTDIGYIPIYRESAPKTSPSPLSAREHKLIGAWANGDYKMPIAQLVHNPAALCEVVHNRLLHTNMIERARLLPFILQNEECRNTLFSEQNIARLPDAVWNRVWDRVGTYYPGDKPAGSDPATRSAYLRELSTHLPMEIITGQIQRQPLHDAVMEQFQALTGLLPMLFGTLSQEERHRTTQALLSALHKANLDKRFLAPLADDQFNTIVVQPSPHDFLTQKIIPTRHAVDIRGKWDKTPVTLPTSLRFQGKIFWPVKMAFHRTQDLAAEGISPILVRTQPRSLEYKTYDNREHEEHCKAHPDQDPNRDAVGELQAVYLNIDPTTGLYTPLILHAHTKLSEQPNQALQPYLEPVNRLNRLTPKGMSVTDLPFDPLACLGVTPADLHAKSFPEVPFIDLSRCYFKPQYSDLRANSEHPAYNQGAYAVHLPPIEINRTQLETLQRLMPTSSLSRWQSGGLEPIGLHQPPVSDTPGNRK